MIGNKCLLSSFKEIKGGSVPFGNEVTGQIKRYGMLPKNDVSLSKVAYVDGVKHNLFSVSELCDNTFDVKFVRTSVPY